MPDLTVTGHCSRAAPPMRWRNLAQATSTYWSSTTRSRSTRSSSSRISVSAQRARAALLSPTAASRPKGSLPVNTNGGGLSYCHPGMYGLFLLIEATRQLRHECGARQIADCETAIAHGNGGVLSSQSTVILGTQARFDDWEDTEMASTAHWFALKTSTGSASSPSTTRRSTRSHPGCRRASSRMSSAAMPTLDQGDGTDRRRAQFYCGRRHPPVRHSPAPAGTGKAHARGARRERQAGGRGDPRLCARRRAGDRARLRTTGSPCRAPRSGCPRC